MMRMMRRKQMNTRNFCGLTVMLVAMLFGAAVRAQSQDPRAWIQNGDYAWNSGNTSAAAQNYNYAYNLAQQKWDWSSELALTQRYLGLGDETQALNVYRAATGLAWN